MNFVSRLPLTSTKKDSVWVIVDRLTKSSNFLPIRTDYSLQKLAKLYMSEIVKLHEVPVSIILDRDSRFTFRLLKKLHEALGTRLDFSTTYHPQSDRKFEQVIQILEDMLGNCVIDLRGSWEDHLPLAEFAYNNSYLSSTQMAPYEALYGSASDRQKSYADLKRKNIEYSVGDQLELPPKLDWIHDVFHVSMLQKYQFDPSHTVPVDEIEVRPNLTFDEEPVQILEQDVKVLQSNTVLLVKVLWRNHSTKEATWEPEDSIC
ncbi:DNA/RNA polymerases superfamily protein [Gossypium australe]|uniref:DNA/RNA polymerases superfamily protein n=1 Tax=Gossypium australe TaxID=47621 RepID=A0A5B6WI41_9ROSI|nr:DNA/RNA polymerases superfamily protein [Gossypium australe]